MSKEAKFQRVDTEDKVGYGRPPKRHRFPPGRSGNPKGRTPRVAYEEDDFPLRRFMMGEIKAKIHGKERKITTLEAVLMKQAAKALAGDTRSAKLLLQYTGGLKDFREEWKQLKSGESMKTIDEVLRIGESFLNRPNDKNDGSGGNEDD